MSRKEEKEVKGSSEEKIPSSAQKIKLISDRLYLQHQQIRNYKGSLEDLAFIIPLLAQKINLDFPAFLNIEGQRWVSSILNSMVTSGLSKQSSEDWLSEQLNPYGIKLFNAGYDGTGRCFSQAFGLLNSKPESLFKKMKFDKHEDKQLAPIDTGLHQIIFEDYIAKHCIGEVSSQSCQVGDLVFHECKGRFDHVSLVIAIVDGKVYLLSKPGSLPSMVHTHDICQYGDIHFKRTHDSVKDSEKLREISRNIIENLLQPYAEVPCMTEATKNYVDRLRFILNDSRPPPLMGKNSEGTKVLLPRFWLRQLSLEAINELSRELDCSEAELR